MSLKCCSINHMIAIVDCRGVLGVTVLGNAFFWGHIPFIQVLAGTKWLNVSPSLAGALASATGWGNVAGCRTHAWATLPLLNFSKRG